MSDTLLLIEDEPLLSAELVRHFRREGFEVITASTLVEAKRLLLHDEVQPLVVISDMSLPDGNALDLLEAIRSEAMGGEWLFLTGYGGVADSVRALRLGAYDFLEKPCELDRLNLVVAGAARSARAQRQLRERAAAQNRRFTPAAFVGRSEAARSVRELLARLARAPFSTLLLTGETGTGKGLAARVLHYSGPRREGPLVEVNCAALPHDLLESELFGHARGAFTGAVGERKGLFEEADGGTIFLDEVGETSPGMQLRLLRVLQEGEIRRLGASVSRKVNVRVLAATNSDLEADVEAGRFRKDLYYRLDVFPIHLPPLRERVEDIPTLAEHFLRVYRERARRAVPAITADAMRDLRAYPFPGNVRELENEIERAVALAEPGQPIGPAHLSERIRGVAARAALPQTLGDAIEQLKRRMIEDALRECGSKTRAAEQLGLTRQSLQQMLRRRQS
jgi:DNA-binding NtrC family response regulator